jgi:hypothetical protein
MSNLDSYSEHCFRQVLFTINSFKPHFKQSNYDFQTLDLYVSYLLALPQIFDVLEISVRNFPGFIFHLDQKLPGSHLAVK